MKQEIICISCQGESRKLFPTDNPYPGEHIKYVQGEALRDFTCDHCGQTIPKDAVCFAFSIWVNHSRLPYYPWEDAYIKITEGGQR